MNWVCLLGVVHQLVASALDMTVPITEMLIEPTNNVMVLINVK